MQVAGALSGGVLVILALVLVAGLSPFIGIPLAVLFLAIPVGWTLYTRSRYADKRSLHSDVPSSRQASYRPAVDPREQP